MHLSEILTHLGEDHEKYFGATAPPVIQTSNFVFKSVAEFRSAIQHEFDEHIYTRGNNPTVKMLREKLAALEETEDALVFPSGAVVVGHGSCLGIVDVDALLDHRRIGIVSST